MDLKKKNWLGIEKVCLYNNFIYAYSCQSVMAIKLGYQINTEVSSIFPKYPTLWDLCQTTLSLTYLSLPVLAWVIFTQDRQSVNCQQNLITMWNSIKNILKFR